ncbi:MAG: class I SAM-dependent DNA methyltransferase, partial [Defluviitaleaceae bacterium]|nr:class I SAM-dependent DNA methyltransferase [Defluviitaleaceae bacterium]
YVLGNPPFLGYSNQNPEQKADILSIYVDEKGKSFKTAGKIDYVAAWYYKAAQYLQDTNIRAAFVSTNSVTQGEQVAAVWKPLFDLFNIQIDFAHRTFKWENEAKGKAAVHCVIVGFSHGWRGERAIYDGDERIVAGNISPYLIDAPNIFVESRRTPLCNIPKMIWGNKPVDGGNLIIEDNEYDDFISREPLSIKYVRRLIGAEEFIQNKRRYCLWLVGANPADLRKMPLVIERIEKCRQSRMNSPKAATQKLADAPTLFAEIRQPDTEYIVVPEISSERRRYIPIGFVKPDIIASNRLQMIPCATLYHFGILTSSTHMAWMRAVCGRMKSDYSYSNTIVYNNFPWPDADEKQQAQIETLAGAVLEVRAKYPTSSLADLYDPLTMPPDLLRAHQKLDQAVMKLYGFPRTHTEADIVANLMQLYQTLV